MKMRTTVTTQLIARTGAWLCLAVAILFGGVVLRADDPTPVSSVKCIEMQVQEISHNSRYYGFNEYVQSTGPNDLPKKYATVTWSGTLSEGNNDPNAPDATNVTATTTFKGTATWSGPNLQNNLQGKIGINGAGDVPYTVQGDGTGACWEIHGAQDVYKLTSNDPWLSLPRTDSDTRTSTVRTLYGAMMIDWTDIYFPCNLEDEHEGSNWFSPTGPVTSTLSGQVTTTVPGTDVTQDWSRSLDPTTTTDFAVASRRWMMDNWWYTWNQFVPGDTTPVLVTANDYNYKAIFRGLCPNAKAIQAWLVVDTWTTGDSNRTEHRIAITASDPAGEDGSLAVSGTLKLDDFFDPNEMNGNASIVGMYLDVDPASCSACAQSQQAGSTDSHPGSIHWQMSLGQSSNLASAGFLAISTETFSSAVYSPSILYFARPSNGNPDLHVVTRPDNSLRQIQTGSTLLDIVGPVEDPTLPVSSFEVRYYTQQGATPSTTNPSLLVPASSPIHTTRFFDPDGSGTHLRIARYDTTVDQAFDAVDFGYNAATQTWSYTEQGLRRTDLQIVPTSSNEYDQITSIWDLSGASPTVVRKVREHFVTSLEHGLTFRVRTSETKDPDGAALTSTWTYDPVSGRQTSSQEYTGAWSMDQTSNITTWWGMVIGRAYTHTAPFGSNGSQAVRESVQPNNNGDQQTTKYDGNTGASTITINQNSLITINGQDFEVAKQSRYVDNNRGPVTWETVRSYASGPFKGKEAYRLSVAGVLDLTTYQLDPATNRTTQTTDHGAPNSDDTVVVDGTREVTVTNPDGNLLSRTVTDIMTGLTVESETVTAYDVQDRPTQISYLDGSTETRTYNVCCGLLQSVSRNGLTTSYAYDLFKRKISETAPDGIVTLYDYDAANRLIRVRRRGTDGSEIVLSQTAYDLADRVVSTTNARGATTTYAETYNPDGTLTRTTTNADASTVVEVNNPDGLPASRSGTQAAPTAWAYSIQQDPATPVKYVVTTEYKGLLGATQPTEFVKTFRDGFSRTVQVQYPDGAKQTSVYNDAEQLTSQTDADGVTTLYSYNAKGEQDTAAVDLNRNGQIDFNGSDRITRTARTVANAHGTTVGRTTTTVWTNNGAADTQDVAVAETSADGLHRWETSFGLTTQSDTVHNADGSRFETTTSPDGAKVASTYQLGRLISAITSHPALGTLASVTYAYDPQGRLQSSTDGRTGATTYTYDNDDQVHSITTPDPDPTQSGDGYDPQTTTYGYDIMGRRNLTTLPDGSTVSTTYYPTGQVKRTWGSRTYPTEYSYDSQGRIATLTTWQDFANDKNRAVTTWNYDSLRGWLASKVYADGGKVSYTYTPGGRLQSRSWARAAATPTTYSYNSAGDLVLVNYYDATPGVTYTYDRLGRLQRRSDAAGACTYVYQGATSLVTAESYTGGLLDGQAISRSFDSLLRVSGTAAAGAVGASYQYDAASRLTQVSVGANTASYTYLPNSALVQGIVFANGATTDLSTTKTYDNLDRLVSIAHTLNVLAASNPQSAALNYAYTYNGANQRTRVTHADGAYWSYGYDPLGQVTSAAKSMADGTPALGATFGYSYDDIGNRKTATANGQSVAYTANLLNQYTQRTVPGTADVLGSADPNAAVTVNGQPAQRQGSTWYQSVTADNSAKAQAITVTVNGTRAGAGPGGADVNVTETRLAYLAQTPEAYTYDADGNLAADGRWAYTWDAENRLIGCETQAVAATAGAPKLKLTFTYDAQGRRVQKKVYNWNAATSTYQLVKDLRYLYDGWNLLADLTYNGTVPTVTCTYTWGLDLSGSLQGAGGVGGLLFRTDSTATYAYAYDGNGNVGALVNLTDGSLAAHYDYNAFGETIEMGGPIAQTNLFRFSTKTIDEETALSYYGYRYYNSRVGKWLSRDKMEEAGGIDLYAMLGNNAVNSYDVLGLYDGPGHFDTIFILYRAAGFAPAEAERLAYLAEYPDINPSYDAMRVRGTAERIADVRQLLHSLTGGDPEKLRQLLRCLFHSKKLTLSQKAVLLHPFGDTYAHSHLVNGKMKLYKAKVGHFLHGHLPDYIASDPVKYAQYVNDSFDLISSLRPDIVADSSVKQQLIDTANSLPKPYPLDFFFSKTQDTLEANALRAGRYGYEGDFHPEDPNQQAIPKFDTADDAPDIDDLMNKIKTGEAGCCQNSK